MFQYVGVLYITLFCSTNSYESAHVDDEQAISAYQYVGVLFIPMLRINMWVSYIFCSTGHPRPDTFPTMNLLWCMTREFARLAFIKRPFPMMGNDWMS